MMSTRPINSPAHESEFWSVLARAWQTLVWLDSFCHYRKGSLSYETPLQPTKVTLFLFHTQDNETEERLL